MPDHQHQEREPKTSASPLSHSAEPRLIVLEGIDLSGRTTQVQLLRDWLVTQRYHVTTTAWRTSPLISDLLARARTGSPLQPLAYSLLYCADHLNRTQQVIKPALARGEIVIADRYSYTAFARDAARGLDSSWVRNLYRFSVQPDIVFYLHISPEEAVKRRMALQHRQDAHSQQASFPLKERKDDKHSHGHKHNKKNKQKHKLELGQVQPSPSPLLTEEVLESFRMFENKMYSAYQHLQEEFGFIVIEGSRPIDQVHSLLRQAITHLLLEM